MISQSRLMELCRYDPRTGKLTWRHRNGDEIWVSAWNTRNAGNEVGSVWNTGYLVATVDGRKYCVHRLIWLFVHGEHPEDFIDHINGIRTDNRVQNLRVARQSINAKNQGMRSTNSSGVMGVSWITSKKRWRAAITVDGLTRHIGYFVNLEKAAEARRRAERQYGFHPNHGRAA